MADFNSVFTSLANVNGWMTRDQAQRLWDRAGELSAGSTVVEIGSFQGRSMCVLASSAPAGVTLYAIDPHGGNDRGPQELDGFAEEAESDHQIFLANLTNAGVRDRVTYLRKYANDATGDVAGQLDLLYVDGAHRFKPASQDIRQWGARVKDGGRLLVHDSFSSIGVTLALVVLTFFSSQWIYEGRSQSMAQFRRGPNTLAARCGSLARQLAQLPYFALNLVYKVLLALRLKPVAKALGSTGEWPY
ncbi:MAG: class I SAM-dependent methyltransferase [Actinomycetes bacterium]